MEKLAKDLGIRLCCNACVTGVSNDGVFLAEEASDGAATNFMSADLVIVNADLPYAKQSLLISQPDHSNAPHNAPLEKYDWDDSFSFSSGVISFHWSLDKVLDDLNTHNVFLAANSRSVAEASWETLRSETNSHNFDDSPFNFYVHRPSKSDPSSAPPGYDSIMVLVPCTTLLRDEECANLPKQEAIERYKLQFSNECVTDVKRAVLKRLAAIDSLKDIESHIVHEAVDTPATWADQFNLAAGTPFALVSRLKRWVVARCLSIPNQTISSIYC
jgi:phytoene dehydrogenase-like protein